MQWSDETVITLWTLKIRIKIRKEDRKIDKFEKIYRLKWKKISTDENLKSVECCVEFYI